MQCLTLNFREIFPCLDETPPFPVMNGFQGGLFQKQLELKEI